MYIVYENDIAKLDEKYLVLELDTIELQAEEYMTAYCVIDNKSVTLKDMLNIENTLQQHKDLMLHYKKQEWDECMKCIAGLTGSFSGELDSFYQALEDRIATLRLKTLNKDWNAAIQPLPIL